jgi:hypothetical protein
LGTNFGIPKNFRNFLHVSISSSNVSGFTTLNNTTTIRSSLNVAGDINSSGLSVSNMNSNLNSESLSSYSFLNISGIRNNLNSLSSYSSLNISNLTIVTNNKQDTYTPERQYPPKAYNSTTGETTTTFLNRTVFTQTITHTLALLFQRKNKGRLPASGKDASHPESHVDADSVLKQ